MLFYNVKEVFYTHLHTEIYYIAVLCIENISKKTCILKHLSIWYPKLSYRFLTQWYS